jgi:hypothetical protein
MEQLKNLADNRLIIGCIYCGGREETRDHVPSRIFLDHPYPENLPVIGACSLCNEGFSLDEQYVACLLECAKSGSTDSNKISRSKIANILNRVPALRARIESAISIKEDQTHLSVEVERMKNVILKLARGHAAFELSRICREEPSSFWWCSLVLLSKSEQDDFDASHVVGMLAEIGSRNIQRFLVTQFVFHPLNGGKPETHNVVINDWVNVQEDGYRYLAIDDNEEIRIKIVIGEYLASEIVWNLDN